MNLNAEIRAELGRRRVTYAVLAELLNTSRQNIQRKLTSTRPISSTDLFSIAHVLNVNASELVRRAEEYENSQNDDTKTTELVRRAEESNIPAA
ncbi:helix-turn-helix transcriptional regulator [Varibaculum sp.]|uniref:helix-turn-helix domain-containing protein n=1 Tax=Varibaculum sp. TaxID=1895474 RepID=UPI0025D20865|nr:helix-turn-helix transcriptional regulator [Varibaculum sp.]